VAKTAVTDERWEPSLYRTGPTKHCGRATSLPRAWSPLDDVGAQLLLCEANRPVGDARPDAETAAGAEEVSTDCKFATAGLGNLR